MSDIAPEYANDHVELEKVDLARGLNASVTGCKGSRIALVIGFNRMDIN